MDYLIGYLILGVILAEFWFWYSRKTGDPISRKDEPAIYFIAITAGIPIFLYYLLLEFYDRARRHYG